MRGQATGYGAGLGLAGGQATNLPSVVGHRGAFSLSHPLVPPPLLYKGRLLAAPGLRRFWGISIIFIEVNTGMKMPVGRYTYKLLQTGRSKQAPLPN
jgi:hypothetical protein